MCPAHPRTRACLPAPHKHCWAPALLIMASPHAFRSLIHTDSCAREVHGLQLTTLVMRLRLRCSSCSCSPL